MHDPRDVVQVKRDGAELDPAALREQLAEAGGLETLRDEIRLSKTIDLLISAARVLPSGEPVEVKTAGSGESE